MQDYLIENGIILPPQRLFVQVPIEFIRCEEYTVREKMIYMYIWTYGITHKVGFPAQPTIAKDLGIGVSTLRNDLKSLERKNGLLMIERRYIGTKEKTTSLYYLGKITTDGTFSKEYLDSVRNLYPDKLKYIPKPIYR